MGKQVELANDMQRSIFSQWLQMLVCHVPLRQKQGGMEEGRNDREKKEQES